MDIILAADDYLNFIHMMKHYKEKLTEMEEEKAKRAADGDGEGQQPAAGTGDSAQWVRVEVICIDEIERAHDDQDEAELDASETWSSLKSCELYLNACF